mmetsp:Transcript_21718/g.49049  ORF Transcript_21718/g.49049 Transcript_21718/m.49049 type:complete len:91 (-) Transcript_21718:12-284(-)
MLSLQHVRGLGNGRRQLRQAGPGFEAVPNEGGLEADCPRLENTKAARVVLEMCDEQGAVLRSELGRVGSGGCASPGMQAVQLERKACGSC